MGRRKRSWAPLWAISLAMLMAGSAGATEPSADELVVFSREARVEVDPEGNVIDVQEYPSLPIAIGRALDANVRGWKFDPPVRNGAPVGGVTYVRLGACAAPIESGGFHLAFQYNGNGPLKLTHGAPAPRYPTDAIMAGVEGSFNVTYRVERDGTTVVEAIETLSSRRAPRYFKQFKAAIHDWMATVTHKPELVDGQAVATRLSMPVEFLLVDGRSKQQENRNLSSCQAALGKAADQDRTVVLDSPFKRLAAN